MVSRGANRSHLFFHLTLPFGECMFAFGHFDPHSLLRSSGRLRANNDAPKSIPRLSLLSDCRDRHRDRSHHHATLAKPILQGLLVD